jgi:hypothetical protein
MNNGLLKNVITVGILIVLFIVAIKVLSFAFSVLLPLAIIVVAAYIVYSFVTRRR